MEELLRSVWTETLKLKRTMAFRLILLTPIIIAGMTFIQYWRRSGYYAGVPDVWYELIMDTFLFWNMLMLPLYVGLMGALLGNIEHSNGGWKLLFSLPIKRENLYFAKLAAIIGGVGVSNLALGGMIIVSGMVLQSINPDLGFNAPVPWEVLLPIMLCSYAASWLMIAIHLWIGLRSHSLVLAVGAAMVAMLASMVLIHSGLAAVLPWTLPASVGLSSGDGISVLPAAIAAAGSIIISVAASIDISRMEVM